MSLIPIHRELKPTFFPPANEVWGKVICLQVCVCPLEGSGPGGCLPWGVSALGGVPALGSLVRGRLVEIPLMATAAGSTHPTGMHSCLESLSLYFDLFRVRFLFSWV